MRYYHTIYNCSWLLCWDELYSVWVVLSSETGVYKVKTVLSPDQKAILENTKVIVREV